MLDMNIADLLSQIDDEISSLQQARTLLAGHNRASHAARKKRTLSADARARIAAAQRKRWAKQKRAAK
jgi:hypothetical protein